MLFVAPPEPDRVHTMLWALPPSPSISLVDSLADIDDLDAFLAAKGDLSCFPTPPPVTFSTALKKDEFVVTAVEVVDEEDDEKSSSLTTPLEDSHIADILSSLAGHQHSSTFYETVLIQDMLGRAQLPPEILGLCYNILRQYNENHLLLPTSSPTPLLPADLLVTASLVLATDFLQDHAPHAHFWSRHITWDVWPVGRIDAAKMHLLHALDWRLLHLAAPRAIQDGVASLHRRRRPLSLPPAATITSPARRSMMAKPLRLDTDASSFSWAHGLITPEATPPGSAIEGGGGGWGSVVLPFL